jgi:hypothetical protein
MNWGQVNYGVSTSGIQNLLDFNPLTCKGIASFCELLYTVATDFFLMVATDDYYA